MFATLSRYIWSSQPEDQKVPDAEQDNFLERGEDEWILVDVVKEKSKTQSVTTDNAKQCRKAVEQEDVNNIDILEESWYVTPPSCFNASEGDSASLQQSPMENLLIEHPSMSVYGGPMDTWLAVEQEHTAVETPEDEFAGETSIDSRTHSHRRGVIMANKAEQMSRNEQSKAVEHSKKQCRKKKMQNHNQTYARVKGSRRKQKKHDRKESKHSSVYSHRGC